MSSLQLSLENIQDLENAGVQVDIIQFQKMLLMYNAIEDGWTVKKKQDAYVFSKPHENKKEVFENNYLLRFMRSHLDIRKIIN
jgi:hypothetical protein